MKKSLFITLALFFIFGCAMQSPAQLTPQEQATAKKEIGEAVIGIVQSLEKMDVEALFQAYADSPDFIFVTSDGSMVDYQTAKIHHAEWFKGLATLKVTAAREEFRFLPGNIVICAWQGKFAMTLKTGAMLKIDNFAITFAFSKIDARWLVIYQHSSALPPIMETPK